MTDATLLALQSALNDQREHVLGILEGLPDEALRQPVLPSGWSCLGLVHHLTCDVEQFWFRNVMAGEPEETAPLVPNAWLVDQDAAGSEILAGYRHAIALADAVIESTPLDAAPHWWPDFFADFRLEDLRAVMLHVITETACHAGHLDAARELIDGRTWLVIT
jgi:uncharacterized damage-inducible protein DinB